MVLLIPVVFAGTGNWFYRCQANSIAEELKAHGYPAIASSIDDIDAIECDRSTLLIVSYAEIIACAKIQGNAQQAHSRIEKFRRRILVNFDCLYSPWFDAQLLPGDDFYVSIFDVGMTRQDAPNTIKGAPYKWIPECLTEAELRLRPNRHAARPIPWGFVGHDTRDRTTLIAALVQSWSPDGFVFSPPLKPFNESFGLQQEALDKVLQNLEFYVWGSHHKAAYHEALRAPMALRAGAIPAKIDPLYSALFDLPWVFSSVDMLRNVSRERGLDELFDLCDRFLRGRGSLGEHLAAAMADLAV